MSVYEKLGDLGNARLKELLTLAGETPDPGFNANRSMLKKVLDQKGYKGKIEYRSIKLSFQQHDRFLGIKEAKAVEKKKATVEKKTVEAKAAVEKKKKTAEKKAVVERDEPVMSYNELKAAKKNVKNLPR